MLPVELAHTEDGEGVIAGVAGLGLTVTVTGADGAELQPFIVTTTV